MKLRISHCIIVAFLCFAANVAKAQIVTANPLEWAVLAEGNAAVGSRINSEIKGQTETAALQHTIAAEYTLMHDWQKKYNDYLKTARGYASSLKACTRLYDDGVKILIMLYKTGKAVAGNPQGVIASMSMNNLYMETATEMMSVYSLLKDAVATGGSDNMLSGVDRSKTLWRIEDRLRAFHRKLNLLYLSIRYYTMGDVWRNATMGIVQRDNGTIASESLARWQRRTKL